MTPAELNRSTIKYAYKLATAAIWQANEMLDCMTMRDGRFLGTSSQRRSLKQHRRRAGAILTAMRDGGGGDVAAMLAKHELGLVDMTCAIDNGDWQ